MFPGREGRGHNHALDSGGLPPPPRVGGKGTHCKRKVKKTAPPPLVVVPTPRESHPRGAKTTSRGVVLGGLLPVSHFGINPPTCPNKSPPPSTLPTIIKLHLADPLKWRWLQCSCPQLVGPFGVLGVAMDVHGIRNQLEGRNSGLRVSRKRSELLSFRSRRSPIP